MDYVLNFPDQLGLHLKSLRKAAGLSPSKLAELMQVTQSRIAAIEKDPASVSVGQFLSILKLLDAALVIRQGMPTAIEAATEAAASQKLEPLLPTAPIKRKVKANSPQIKEFAVKPLALPADWKNKQPKGSW